MLLSNTHGSAAWTKITLFVWIDDVKLLFEFYKIRPTIWPIHSHTLEYNFTDKYALTANHFNFLF